MDADPLGLELGGFFLIGLIGTIAQERTLEGRFQESVEAVDIVPVAGDGELEGNASFGGEDQVFADAVEVCFQRGAVACSGQAAETLAGLGANELADVDRVGVDDEKGGWPSPPNAQKAWHNCCMSGVSRARRSANF